MLNLTLKQLFGQNATQDAQNLTIYKSDLPRLTASSNNRAEQLLVAILLLIHKSFEGVLKSESGITITSEAGRAITYKIFDIYESTEVSQWNTQFVSRESGKFIVDTFLIFYYEKLN